jgi:TonB family protein
MKSLSSSKKMGLIAERKFTTFSSQRGQSDRKGLGFVCYFGSIMQRSWVAVLLFLIGAHSFGQSQYDAGPTKDARAVFTEIAPYYDFTDSSLKPWHLKVNYQLSDEKGNPTEQGVFEYWWASPNVYRSTWKRGNSTHSEWSTADGKHFIQSTGEPLAIFEYWLQSALLSPLPKAEDLDPAKSILVDHSLASANSHSRCMMVVPSAFTEPVAKNLPFGLYPEYCVNKSLPILLGYYRFGTIMVKLLNTVPMQGKSMPRELYIIEQSHEILEAKADPVDMIAATDPALIPPGDAKQVDSEGTQVGDSVESRLLIKKVAPIYPDDAKAAHMQGKVVLRTVIGPDGRVQDVRLVSAPSPSLALSAFHSVSQWQYQPSQVNGKPVIVETTVEIDFSSSS